MIASMKLRRRSILGLAGIAPVALATCTTRRAAATDTAPAPPPSGEARWARMRGDFLLSRDRIHLASLLIASNPTPVREAINRIQASLDEDPVTLLEHEFTTSERTNATLAAAAQYMGVAPDEIALTDSTTSGIAVIYGGMAFQRGDEIVTTKHDHFVTHESLRLAADRTGATVRTVTLYEKGLEARAGAMVKAIESALTPSTRVVAVTWVHSCTGVKIPVRAIADAIAKANASRGPRERILLCVDGVHGFGIEDVSMADLGCDFFIAGCHKWIFGPRGTGLVWGRPEAWERVVPTACPFHIGYVFAREYGGPVPKPAAGIMSPGGFRAFEHRWALAEAFKYHLQIGKSDVQRRIHDLARQCRAGLASMRHVTLHTPLDASLASGIVCFEVAGMKPPEVVAALLAKGIIGSATPYLPSYARLTPSLVNTPEEIERTLAAVRDLA